MKLKPEEFKAKTAEILSNLSDQAKVSTLLAELTEHNDDAVVEVTTSKSTAEKLTADNEKLRQANMSLFLKVGESKPADETKPNEDTTPKFEDLFDKDGNLK
jgi:transcription-repair coupling factor (superfamily II helicase)